LFLQSIPLGCRTLHQFRSTITSTATSSRVLHEHLNTVKLTVSAINPLGLRTTQKMEMQPSPTVGWPANYTHLAQYRDEYTFYIFLSFVAGVLVSSWIWKGRLDRLRNRQACDDLLLCAAATGDIKMVRRCITLGVDKETHLHDNVRFYLY
jgi:hypothetical protein